MKFTAAGDALLQQRVPESYAGKEKIAEFISRGDARFFNLETTLNYTGECYASQFSGGTYMRTTPENFKSMLSFGFNMTSFNNNHTMDFSYEGMLKTLSHVRSHDIVNSGVGSNLREASSPAYLDTPHGRAALISVNTTFEPCMMAGNQSRLFPGRPGINGIRLLREVRVSKEDFETIKKISRETGVNAEKSLHISQGYSKENLDGTFEMGSLRFALYDEPGFIIKANEEDIDRVLKSIYEAQLQADYIIISIHTHEMAGSSMEIVPDFLKTFAHSCIDAGAHAVIGHGPHLLRPVEVYKDCPIFYSLGDFILQLYSVDAAPEDFYEKQGLTSDSTIHELLKKRSNNFKRGLMEDSVMSESVIPYWEMESGKLTRLELLPITCKAHENKSVSGLPLAVNNPDFFERLVKMSAPYGVKMELVNGKIICKW